jgi:hypothetical protein
MELQNKDYKELITGIGNLLTEGRGKAALQVNTMFSTNLLGNR